MTLQERKNILEIQLGTIFSDLQKIDDDIKCIDQRIKNLNEEMTRTGDFSSIQLEWEELTWDKWMYTQKKEQKLLLADEKLEEMKQLHNHTLT